MNVICLHDDAFYALIREVVKQLKDNLKTEDKKWISGEEVMQKLHITSKTTLQKLRDEGHIRFSQPERKIILYDSESINEYLNKHTHKTF